MSDPLSQGIGLLWTNAQKKKKKNKKNLPLLDLSASPQVKIIVKYHEDF